MRETRSGVSVDRKRFGFSMREPEMSGRDIKRNVQDIYLTDHVDIFKLTARIMNGTGLTNITVAEHEDQTRNGHPLDREKVRLIVADHKQSGYLDNFWSIVVGAVVARSMMREQKIPVIEQQQRLFILIDDRASLLQLSIPKLDHEQKGKKRTSRKQQWNKRRYDVFTTPPPDPVV